MDNPELLNNLEEKNKEATDDAPLGFEPLAGARGPECVEGSQRLELISNRVHLIVSVKVTTLPRADCAVILAAPPGLTEEFNLEKLQPPKRLTVAVPITAPVVSGPTYRVILFPDFTVLFPLICHHFELAINTALVTVSVSDAATVMVTVARFDS